ncbi:hypothetical protein ACS0TY_017165 [Phlomoides rotata]
MKVGELPLPISRRLHCTEATIDVPSRSRPQRSAQPPPPHRSEMNHPIPHLRSELRRSLLLDMCKQQPKFLGNPHVLVAAVRGRRVRRRASRRQLRAKAKYYLDDSSEVVAMLESLAEATSPVSSDDESLSFPGNTARGSSFV